MFPLSVGQAIRHNDKDGVLVHIHGNQSPETCGTMSGCVSYGGSAEFDVVWSDGTQSKRLPEALVRTSRIWEIIEGVVATAEDVAAAIRFADEKAVGRKAEEAAAETTAAAMREADIARFIAENPTLKVQTPGTLNAKGERYSDHALGALNLKTQFTERYPGIKFSVQSRTYSGGESIDVRWTEGPTSAEIDAMCSPYEKGTFNGSDDSYSFKRDRAWNDTFGSARHVSTRRDLGATLKFSMASAICQRLGIEFTGYEQVPFPDDHDDLGTHADRCLYAVSVPAGCTEVTGLHVHEGGSFTGHGKPARFEPIFAIAPAPAETVADRRSTPLASKGRTQVKRKATPSAIVDGLNARNAPTGGWSDKDRVPKAAAVRPAAVAAPAQASSASSPRRLPAATAALVAAVKKVPSAMLGYLAKQAVLPATEDETVRADFTAWITETDCAETDWRQAWAAFATRSRRGDEVEAAIAEPEVIPFPVAAIPLAAMPTAPLVPATAGGLGWLRRMRKA